jgi:hypothetical protein
MNSDLGVDFRKKVVVRNRRKLAIATLPRNYILYLEKEFIYSNMM